MPFFLVTRKRSEAALISLVQEAFINGVSTRKRERLAPSLGIESLSASLASEITRELDERVKESRTRPLKAEYVFVWIDALYEKVRFEGKVVSVAIMIAYGLDEEGRREIRRRSRVVGVFPSVESYLRLAISYLIEHMEDWVDDYAYIKANKLGPILEQEERLAAN